MQQLSWPSEPTLPLGSLFAKYFYGWGFILIAIVVFFHSRNSWAIRNTIDTFFYPGLVLILGAIGYLLLRSAGKTREANEKAKQGVLLEKQRAMQSTYSVLMSKAEYVGGHPLLPQTGVVVLGLKDSELTIYTFKDSPPSTIQPAASIPLLDIDRTGTGRPKTAREIHDDYGSTIDVIEQSPFLHISFTAKGDTYQASFQNFEPPNTPVEFSNQIAAVKYKLKSEA